MKNNIENYMKELDIILNKKQIKKREQVLESVLTKITFFQHERLVHLIVTCFIGIIAIICLGLAILFENLGFIILFILMFILFIPYICHYYYLENYVQKLYNYYDKLENKLEGI